MLSVKHMTILLTKHLVVLSNVFFVYLRAFVGIIDEYFAGYYTEDMIESQVMIIFPVLFSFLRKEIFFILFPESHAFF